MATNFPMLKTTGPLNAMAGVGDGQTCKVMICEFSWTAALVINDKFLSPLIQKGSVISDVVVFTDSMGAAAVTLDVGDDGDPDRYIAASTIGVAGGVARASAATARPQLLTVNDTVDVIVKVAPTTPTTSGKLYLVIYYTPLNT